ncbi:MAG: hypothetical protein AAGG48_19265 [Planctomycetota bacterium]
MSDAYLDQLHTEWRTRAPELAAWVYRHLVNRTDVWGRYLAKRNRKQEPDKKGGFLGNAITAPFRDERGKVFLNTTSLEKHFKAIDGGVLGVHSVGTDWSSRWFAIDIDRHDDTDLSITREGNFVAAREWYDSLQQQGFDPLLFDSNGFGGFHLWVVFEQPMSSRSVRSFVDRFVADFQRRGLDRKPDLFPGEPGANALGSWLRLPGRHHTRPHYTRVYNDQAWDDRPWLEGHDAIDRILATRLAPLELSTRVGIESKTKTICVDFDGVIHSYRSGWQGVGTIPDPPIHGVDKAIATLRRRYRVVVYSARTSTEEGRNAIAAWLEKHNIEVDEVCEHKPPAHVYIDDRAIPFTGDWEQTMIDVNEFRK